MESSNSLVGKLWRSPSVGGDSGEPFSDINWPPPASDQVLAQQAKPVKVNVRIGRYVDQIQMLWANRELPVHGGEGSPLEPFVLEANEYIANVRLTGKRYVGS
ncbi:MAG: hypothetical protein F6K11_35305, partial [Leptolyngbya sp. SIO3F4]|nr:hypothetical protein [Leptolyngbya sp. SIO3F4]